MRLSTIYGAQTQMQVTSSVTVSLRPSWHQRHDPSLTGASEDVEGTFRSATPLRPHRGQGNQTAGWPVLRLCTTVSVLMFTAWTYIIYTLYIGPWSRCVPSLVLCCGFCLWARRECVRSCAFCAYHSYLMYVERRSIFCHCNRFILDNSITMHAPSISFRHLASWRKDVVYQCLKFVYVSRPFKTTRWTCFSRRCCCATGPQRIENNYNTEVARCWL